ncbi:MAG: hypothetical protein M3067_15610 [Chloroflexota bacterium]|nr:hypothetical protein [Chloroflexota bacterium]
MSERFDTPGQGRREGRGLQGPALEGALESALVDLGRALAFPTPTAGFAERVTARLGASGVVPTARPWWHRLFERPPSRPVRRALLLAIALVIILAAVAGALGLGLPGIRLILGPTPTATPTASAAVSGPPTALPTASPSAPPSGPGSALEMGQAVSLDSLSSSVPFPPRLPTDARVGPPDAAYVLSDRLSLVWAPGPSLPATLAPDVGLVLTEFQGRLDPGYFEKSINSGTTVQPVSVNGQQGYWIDGVPHFFFYVDANGVGHDETRRFVGKVLIWTSGDLTLRLETSLSRDEAIAIASSIP